MRSATRARCRVGRVVAVGRRDRGVEARELRVERRVAARSRCSRAGLRGQPAGGGRSAASSRRRRGSRRTRGRARPPSRARATPAARGRRRRARTTPTRSRTGQLAHERLEHVDPLHGRRRVVDGRRKRADRRVDDDPHRERGVLLDRALLADLHARPQHVRCDRACACARPVHAQQQPGPGSTNSPTRDRQLERHPGLQPPQARAARDRTRPRRRARRFQRTSVRLGNAPGAVVVGASD